MSFVERRKWLPSGALRPARPLSREPEVRPTPLAALLLDSGTPTDLHFVRNHFGVPPVDAETWVLEVAGAVERLLRISSAELLRARPRTVVAVLECAGHRRNEFSPQTDGVPWETGAVSEARWTGVPLAALLDQALPNAAAREVVFEGADRGQHQGSQKPVLFSRSIPLDTALLPDVLVAWEMNGAPIPAKHGGPLRAIVPGNYAVDSVKWLRRIEVRAEEFEGPFQRDDYRLVGSSSSEDETGLHELRISSLIVEPQAGAVISAGRIEVSGVTWAGRAGVDGVDVRLAGRDWQPATLDRSRGKFGLVRWATVLEASRGTHVVEARAWDGEGSVQPPQPEWNLYGYANNSIHRITVEVVSA